jgi:hypothetical protein
VLVRDAHGIPCRKTRRFRGNDPEGIGIGRQIDNPEWLRGIIARCRFDYLREYDVDEMADTTRSVYNPGCYHPRPA